jgi:ABC-type antimicrobial peptide transport system permease subunit
LTFDERLDAELRDHLERRVSDLVERSMTRADAYQVALRTREIGIRSALGADRQAIVNMVLKQGVKLTVAGTAVGVVGAASAGGVMQSLLYETPAISAPSYVGVAAFVLLVGTAAAWLPAQRGHASAR